MEEENKVLYHPIPQQDEIPRSERDDAMGAYLMMFAAVGVGLPLPFINILAAVIYYFVNRNKSRFVKFHALQSLLSQMITSLMNSFAILWLVGILTDEFVYSDSFINYVIVTAIANLIYFGFSIFASVRAYNGRFFYFLFFGRIAYHFAYKVKEEKEQTIINKPPL